MKELRAAVAGLRAEVDAFGAEVVAKIEAVRAETLGSFADIEGPLTELRPAIDAAVAKARAPVETLDAELAALGS